VFPTYRGGEHKTESQPLIVSPAEQPCQTSREAEASEESPMNRAKLRRNGVDAELEEVTIVIGAAPVK
jgi:hypothetical protein